MQQGANAIHDDTLLMLLLLLLLPFQLEIKADDQIVSDVVLRAFLSHAALAHSIDAQAWA